MPEPGQWCLYLIECSNGAWYAGITNHLAARYAAHATGRGARYTRANPPRHLLGWRPYPDRSSASRAEAAIKKLDKARKIPFLQADSAPGEKLLERAQDLHSIEVSSE
ncbi:MAG TPA: GIY-YIG nuclease family protein [Dyella sp.]|nr:GIY-YIG nuclease family protein [Dyella sp.]